MLSVTNHALGFGGLIVSPSSKRTRAQNEKKSEPNDSGRNTTNHEPINHAAAPCLAVKS